MSDTIKKLIDAIFTQSENLNLRFMDFCGGHTYAIAQSGISEILPPNIQIIHGPGCPVCVIPTPRIDMAINAAKIKNVILCTYGDVLKVPNSNGFSLFKMKAENYDIMAVYSVLDALKIADDNPTKKVVFFAVGFETTAPLTAAAVLKAKEKKINNFFVITNHLTTDKAMQVVINDSLLNGIIAPGHVAAITGFAPFEKLSNEFKTPMVVTGFEAIDIITAILMLIRQVKNNLHDVQNEYKRAINPLGNPEALTILNTVFSKRKNFTWRGLGNISDSAFDFSPEYEQFDAEKAFSIRECLSTEPANCLCSLIIRGKKIPPECPLFGKICKPETPVGACMVSSEGTCGAYYKYRGKL